MKKCFLLVAIILHVSGLISAQSDADKFRVDKPKILSKLDKLALAQITVNYKLTTTAKTIAKGNLGGVAGARVTAYLEITDGDLTENDFQEITDYFYSYFERQLQSNGIDTVAWSTITATDFYKNADKPEPEKEEDKHDKGGNVWVTSTAHHGNILHGRHELGFAFGKIKKGAAFAEEIGAPAGYFYLTVDFADVVMGLEIKQTSNSLVYGGWYTPGTTSKKYTWGVNPTMTVGQAETGLTLFWNKKSQGEVLWLTKEISGASKYNDRYSEDMSKARSGLAKQFAFRKEMTPVLIETTKEKYKAAAKKTLEKYADAFIEKVKALKKA
jgi:hypothetical protein